MMTSTATSPIDSRLSWYRGLTGKHWRVLTASFLGWVFDGYEAYALVIVIPFVLKSMLTPAQFADRAIWAGTAIGVTLLGWGLGGLTGGVLADYVGRKRMMIYSVLGYALFSGITALATSFSIFCFLRFITG